MDKKLFRSILPQHSSATSFYGILLQKRRQPRIYKALRKDPKKGYRSQKQHIPYL